MSLIRTVPVLSSSHRRTQNRHLVITSLIPAALNCLLISIIVYQFGVVYCADSVGIVATRNASSDNTNNETSYHYQQPRHETDNNTEINLTTKKSTRRAPAECTQEPKFSLLTSDSLLKSANVSYDEKKAEIWTFGRFYLILECSASRPIDFNFEGHLVSGDFMFFI